LCKANLTERDRLAACRMRILAAGNRQLALTMEGITGPDRAARMALDQRKSCLA